MFLRSRYRKRKDFNGQKKFAVSMGQICEDDRVVQRQRAVPLNPLLRRGLGRLFLFGAGAEFFQFAVDGGVADLLLLQNAV